MLLFSCFLVLYVHLVSFDTKVYKKIIISFPVLFFKESNSFVEACNRFVSILFQELTKNRETKNEVSMLFYKRKGKKINTFVDQVFKVFSWASKNIVWIISNTTKSLLCYSLGTRRIVGSLLIEGEGKFGRECFLCRRNFVREFLNKCECSKKLFNLFYVGRFLSI